MVLTHVDFHVEYIRLLLAIQFAGARMAQPVVVKQYIERRPKPKSPYERGSFMMISQRGLSELEERLADRSLGMQAVRVLMAMLNSATYGNLVEASQKDISLRLGMSLSEVSKASHALMDCGLIDRMANRRGWYKINPRLAWKGNVESLEQALKAREAA